MMKQNFKLVQMDFFKWERLLFFVGICCVGCEQQIQIELPDSESFLIVDGAIETGGPPIVFVGRSQDYFDAVDASGIEQSFLSGALVQVSSQGQTYTLDEICTGDLTPEGLAFAADILGFSAESIALLNLCVYTSFEPSSWGEPGNTYDLDVLIDDEELHAITEILPAVPIDSLRWSAPGTNDTLGFVYASFSDPDELGNAYRWFAKRINVRPDWDPLAGQVKDVDFIAPLGSVFDDRFFNGLSFEFGTFRGQSPGSQAWDDDISSPESGFFKISDTVVVKMCAIDLAVYDAVASYENLILSQGSPFALPANMTSNVEGGLGLWAGYCVWQDTLICLP
jgi:hypothetical protein